MGFLSAIYKALAISLALLLGAPAFARASNGGLIVLSGASAAAASKLTQRREQHGAWTGMYSVEPASNNRKPLACSNDFRVVPDSVLPLRPPHDCCSAEGRIPFVTSRMSRMCQSRTLARDEAQTTVEPLQRGSGHWSRISPLAGARSEIPEQDGRRLHASYLRYLPTFLASRREARFASNRCPRRLWVYPRKKILG
jgi:hypothetical protein